MHEDIKKSVDVLRSGGLILYPADTGWALGCDATNEEAVKRLFEVAENGSENVDRVVLIDTASRLQVYVDEVPDMAWDLIDLSEKPLTIIYPKAKNLAGSLIAADGTIAIRVTNETFSQRLCQQFRKPVACIPVAKSGKAGSMNFNQISNAIKSAVDHTVTFGQEAIRKPAIPSIIKLGKGNLIEIIRE